MSLFDCRGWKREIDNTSHITRNHEGVLCRFTNHCRNGLRLSPNIRMCVFSSHPIVCPPCGSLFSKHTCSPPVSHRGAQTFKRRFIEVCGAFGVRVEEPRITHDKRQRERTESTRLLGCVRVFVCLGSGVCVNACAVECRSINRYMHE